MYFGIFFAGKRLFGELVCAKALFKTQLLQKASVRHPHFHKLRSILSTGEVKKRVALNIEVLLRVITVQLIVQLAELQKTVLIWLTFREIQLAKIVVPRRLTVDKLLA